ncbi:MAG: hypothetical protein IIZ59_03950 [Clostridia bacterium]|nr:hypothetical protein [Clostridia bacterium]
MRKLKVESFDGNMVIFIDTEKKYFAIEKSEIPFALEKGDWVEIDSEGNITHIKYNV